MSDPATPGPTYRYGVLPRVKSGNVQAIAGGIAGSTWARMGFSILGRGQVNFEEIILAQNEIQYDGPLSMQ